MIVIYLIVFLSLFILGPVSQIIKLRFEDVHHKSSVLIKEFRSPSYNVGLG